MTNATNENNCILAKKCTLAGSDKCADTCASYIALHSKSGRHTLADIPRDYSLVTLENAPPRSEQAEAYRMVEAYTKTFVRQFEADGERVKSLYLFSESPGTGKTTTASAVINSWIQTHYIGSVVRNRQTLQRPAFFLDVNALQTLYNGFNRSNIPREVAEPKAREYYRMLERAKSAPFAVYDDIGVRDCTEAFRGDLHDAINYRVANGTPTVYTSNIPITELVDVFDDRLYDRIRDNTIQIKFTGESKRGVRK